MNTQQTTRIRDDPELALRRRDVNDEEYDQHWHDRQLPGNQKIYDRESEQLWRRHEEYCENTARSLARRYASRGAPGPRFHRPQGRVTGPSPLERDISPQAHLTQERLGASQRRGSTSWWNERGYYGSHKDQAYHPRRVGRPPVTAVRVQPCLPPGRRSKAGDTYRPRLVQQTSADQPRRTRART